MIHIKNHIYFFLKYNYHWREEYFIK